MALALTGLLISPLVENRTCLPRAANQSKLSEEYVCNLWHVKFGWSASPRCVFSTSPPRNKFHWSRTTQLRPPDIQTMGNAVVEMIRMLKSSLSIYHPCFYSTGWLFTLEMNAASLLLAHDWALLPLRLWRRCARQSQSTFIKSVVLWVPTLPLQSFPPLFGDLLASVFILLSLSLPMIITVICTQMDAHASLKLLKSIF